MISPRLASGVMSSLLLVLSSWAQLGDRADPTQQRPPNPDIEIPQAPVLSADEALKSFVLPPHFHVELVAAEPLVHDPVMMAFDARGRIWVAELSAYNAEFITERTVFLPKDQPAPPRPVGRVVMLEDTDGDGRVDKRSVYWDNMNVPRAIAFLGDGVIIGDPPNLWLTHDRDGDGVMDERRLISDDYGTPENIEASPNGLLWGRDNWLYNASYKWRWRFSAGDDWQREPMPVLGQWGMTQDDFGRLFYNTNSAQLRGDFLPSHYSAATDRRLPLFGVNYLIAADQTTWPIRTTPGVNRGYRDDQLRGDGSLAKFTAASAPLIYRGTNFPATFSGNAFVPEPAGNLVKRNLLLEAEGRLSALSSYQGTEFLASTDERFRPVYLANGPDGALYVVDYYRGVLEGYQFITTYLRDQILKRGLNEPLWGLGRIYRVVFDGGPRAERPDFIHADAKRLTQLLADENGWTRDTAQRRIVESASNELPPLLRAEYVRAARPRDRVSILWCLDGLRALTIDDARRALTDPDARVRMAGLQAAERYLRDPANESLLNVLAGVIDREQPIVLAQLALTLAGTDIPFAREILWQMLWRAQEHPSLADSVIIALRGQEREVLKRLRDRIVAAGKPVFGAVPLLESVAASLALGSAQNGTELVAAICDPALPQWSRLALMRGAIRLNQTTLLEESLTTLTVSAPDAVTRRQASEVLTAWRQRATRRAARPAILPLTPEQQTVFDGGRATYGLCAACHQPDGQGLAGVAPSLRDGRWSNAVSPDAVIRIVLKGKEGTPGFPASMPPLQTLSDEQLAGVLTFIRRSWGNGASAVTPAEVAVVRRAIESRSTPWTDAELMSALGEPK